MSLAPQAIDHDPVRALFSYRHNSKASEWPSLCGKDLCLNQISMENLNPVYLRQDDGQHVGADLKVQINAKRRRATQVDAASQPPQLYD